MDGIYAVHTNHCQKEIHMPKPIVSVIMGSDSDLPVMKATTEILEYFNIPYEIDVVSAHRTPERAFEFAKNAHTRGIKVIVAGAGGAAHLAGVMAAISPLPIIGVPIKSSLSIDGWDSILSTLQMPSGIPVATVGLNGGRNAGILAAQILSIADNKLRESILEYKEQLKENVLKMSANLKKK